MKIKSVQMMREIRDQISSDIKQMQWDEEQKYLQNHIKTFDFLTKKNSNKSMLMDSKKLG